MELLQAYADRILPLESIDGQVFSALFREKIIKKGEFFSEEGKIASQLTLLSDGVVRFYYTKKEGVECCTQFFVPKQWIADFSSLLSGQPAQLSIQALSDCRVWVADFSAITALYDQHPTIERWVRLLVQEYYIHKEKREIERSKRNADERYLSFLKEFPMLESLLPQYQIASYLNISASQLSRVRSMTLMVGW